MKYPGSKLPSLFFKTLGKEEKELYKKVVKRYIDDLISDLSKAHHIESKKTQKQKIRGLYSEINRIQVKFQ